MRIILLFLSLFSIGPLCWPTLTMAKTMPLADHIVIYKSQRRLQLYQHDKLLASYPISLGRDPVNPKRRRNDTRTPEGEYKITFHTRHSTYTAALGISYPNKQDKARAQAAHVDPGDNIEIHGMPPNAALQQRLRGKDWTAGCIALSNHDMNEVYTRTRDGARVTIVH